MSNLRAYAVRRVRPRHPWDSPYLKSRRYSIKAVVDSAPRKRPRALVSTLTPSLIKSTDYLDLSQRISLPVRFPVSYASASGQGLSYGLEGTVYLPFPDHTRGFLYSHSDPNAAPLAGSIRFRVTSDNSPSSFSGGHDLVAPSGYPWQVTLAQIAWRRKYAWIAAQLVHENHATREQLSRCRDVFGRKARIYPEYTLFHLDSTFLVNFSSPVNLTVVGEGLHPFTMTYLFRAFSPERNRYFPWTGSALARFEPSTRPEHTGLRVLHLRILKIVKPVATIVDLETYSGHPLRPEEGQLFMVRSPGGAPRPWAYDIDKGTRAAAALRVLWNNSRTP
ncbi:hypothetical protein FB451DRAFT_1409117 [Mycena latifolia]|nr:hypothetical protein FB451DRAFT_1409117 [Mycena latifolia]